MCELLGASLKKKESINSYITEFFSHSVYHPHGWGIMRETNGAYEIIKEPLCAAESKLASFAAENTEPQKCFLAHIRLATVGLKNELNCHPFSGTDLSGRRWVLVHNGTLYSENKTYPYRINQKGSTDSERIFLYLIDLLNSQYSQNNNYLSDQQRFDIVDKLVQNLSKRNKLNLIIFDGDLLYVHKNMEATLHYIKTDNGYIFSTQPLICNGWSEFPISQLLAYKDGKKVFAGTKHEKVFVPTLQYITAMDAMNI